MSARDPLDSLSLYDRSANRVSAPRKFYCRWFGRCDSTRYDPRAEGDALLSRSQSPRLLETRTSSGTYQEESLTYDSLFMYSSFLMQNSDVEDLW